MGRAVYHDADIYLLDDPLAAVDAHVGKHMFQKCIVEELLQGKHSGSQKKNSVILVTNAIQYLSNPHVSRIVVLNQGTVAEVGTYKQLSNNPDSLFSAMLSVMEESGGQNNREAASVLVDEESEKKPIEPKPSMARKLSASLTLFLAPKSEKNIKSQATKKTDIIREDPMKVDTIDPKLKPTTPLMTNELQGMSNVNCVCSKCFK